MTKLIKAGIFFIFLTVLVSCKNNHFKTPLHPESLTPNETEQVDTLLKHLYQSFCYGKAEEPDWELMRSVFFERAQFVSEVPCGESPKSQTIEAFISSWQNSIRESTTPTVATSERIISTKAIKLGKLIRVDVEFQAVKSNDPSPRKPGLDSIVLANVHGIWKILSFIIHYESKL